MKSKSVAVIVFHPESREILLVKRRDVPIWVLPGGGIDPGESTEAAALRELQEETGLRATIVRQVAHYIPANRLSQVTDVYECSPEGGELTRGCESADVAFFPINTLPKPLLPTHLCWINDALRALPTPIYKQVEATALSHLMWYIVCHPILCFRFFLARIGLPYNSRDRHKE